MEVRLRDFVVSKDDWIFSVSSYDNEDGIKSTLRYFPDKNGNRIKNGKKFRKLEFEESFEFLKDHKPGYIKGFRVIIPKGDVKEVLSANKRLPDVLNESEKIKKIVKCLKKNGISESSMGITGSFLCGLQNESSDIDFVVYGSDWFLAKDIIQLEKAKEDSEIFEVSEELWHKIYKKRNPELSYEEFFAHEIRKGHRGMVGDTYFDLLYVRDWTDIRTCGENEQIGEDFGYETIVAKVKNTDFCFDSPAIYEVEHEYVDYVLSYTHTYVGQALPSEIIEARGKIEKIGNRTRLIVGTTRRARGEWIKSLTLLDTT